MRRQRRIPALIAISAAGLIVIGLVVTAVAYGARGLFTGSQTYTVELTTYPTESRVILNNEEPTDHEGTQTYDVDDDELHLIVDRDEFSGHEDTYTLEANQTNEITVELVPQTEAAEAMLREQTDYYPGQAAITEESLERAEQLEEDNAILGQLPHETDTFRAYQGISDTEDFGIHVYVYPSTEAEGRQAFTDWLEDEGFNPNDYDIIYHLDEDGPAIEADAPPSAEDLANAAQPDISDYDGATPDSDDPDVIVKEFLAIANTSDTIADTSPSAALLRAEGYMTEDKAETLFEPQNPIVSPIWRDAATDNAVSLPWVYAIDARQQGDSTTIYNARVCWAWIPDGSAEPSVDLPRSWDISVTDTPDGPRIADFTYQDAYVGDDPEASICTSHL